ncbi:hypothetical protein EH165_12955 [Nakamurella antarctica]|uniref:DUF6779 domain-containing protein n=1 Tax=Nakamurella antarctica TaxID=1902245 RepID=A0A3G8ZWU4_9ACTN|nr:DUF6779 domain-containing protein [Nakamurella antarctica]AZI58914.1 hypothetical protein EH165_12955 [Nakamurella antarctica]
MSASDGGRRKGATDVLKWLVGISIVLAAVAAVVGVLSDTPPILRLALVLALWAFAIGGFATVRARRETRLAENKRDEAKLTYDLELQREINARREHERRMSDELRGEFETAHQVELRELRDQVQRLNETVSKLFDGNLLFERLTLSAESTRVRAVGSDGGRGELSPMYGPARANNTGYGISESGAGYPDADDSDIMDAEFDDVELGDVELGDAEFDHVELGDAELDGAESGAAESEVDGSDVVDSHAADRYVTGTTEADELDSFAPSATEGEDRESTSPDVIHAHDAAELGVSDPVSEPLPLNGGQDAAEEPLLEVDVSASDHQAQPDSESLPAQARDTETSMEESLHPQEAGPEPSSHRWPTTDAGAPGLTSSWGAPNVLHEAPHHHAAPDDVHADAVQVDAVPVDDVPVDDVQVDAVQIDAVQPDAVQIDAVQIDAVQWSHNMVDRRRPSALGGFNFSSVLAGPRPPAMPDRDSLPNQPSTTTEPVVAGKPADTSTRTTGSWELPGAAAFAAAEEAAPEASAAEDENENGPLDIARSEVAQAEPQAAEPQAAEAEPLGDHSTGLSVAELLASYRSATAEVRGRRRRRYDDSED